MVAKYGEWGDRGATLSDKSARKEYGLTQDQILAAIDAGTLDYRIGSVHGNPWLRLLRSEVEELVRSLHGSSHLERKRDETELARVTSELKRLRSEVAVLEERRADLLDRLGTAAGGTAAGGTGSSRTAAGSTGAGGTGSPRAAPRRATKS